MHHHPGYDPDQKCQIFYIFLLYYLFLTFLPSFDRIFCKTSGRSCRQHTSCTAPFPRLYKRRRVRPRRESTPIICPPRSWRLESSLDGTFRYSTSPFRFSFKVGQEMNKCFLSGKTENIQEKHKDCAWCCLTGSHQSQRETCFNGNSTSCMSVFSGVGSSTV